MRMGTTKYHHIAIDYGRMNQMHGNSLFVTIQTNAFNGRGVCIHSNLLRLQFRFKYHFILHPVNTMNGRRAKVSMIPIFYSLRH